MIWICLDNLGFPDGWAEKRISGEQLLAACRDAAARKDLLDGPLAKIWRALAEKLAELSHDKCWYCETPIARDDFMVDHYRPKGKVLEDAQHPGYWWLALDPRNFRLACRYCNERRVDRRGGTDGGKAAHFPLMAGSRRAFRDDYWEDEDPVLLDPTRVLDPPLIAFLSDGSPTPSDVEDDNPDSFQRATYSIEIYHLTHSRLMIQRSLIANQVTEAVRRVDVAYRRYLRKGQAGLPPDEIAGARSAYRDAVDRLAAYGAARSPYAAVARSVMKQQRSDDRGYLDVILQSL
ncbi:hypothetical protein M8C17_10930 [Micromonospora sp. RHAY321]|uniref:hypothetical protein n=1 Tax=Micromonospora sp. RHAY321 TaxID=2944807 RepID=UPI00207C9F8D|nr:hypothetical protein [Micromonospora sp. RHAY321]MCO1595678.1 hypothetical protein [Micromonospora sp. RHAY321]